MDSDDVAFSGSPDDFDEEMYCAENADVLAAIKAGTLKSGREHFKLYGQSEGRTFFRISDRNQSGFKIKDQRYHDVIAKEYNAIIVAPRQVANDWIFQKADAHIPSGERMLDLGCGTGHLTLRFSSRFKEATAVDHSIGMLEQARHDLARNGIKNVQLIRSNIFEFMESEVRKFSLISCVGFLHHLTENDIGRVLRWSAKHLELNGRFIVSEPIKIPMRTSPPRIEKWNASSKVMKMAYSVNPTPPDEEHISLEFFRSTIREAGRREVFSLRSWEVFPQNEPPAFSDRMAIRIFNWLYGKSGNVFTTIMTPLKS